MRTLAVILAWGALLPAFPQAIPHAGDWPLYGRDAGGTRYSPLDQINTRNVATLERAWTFHTQERGRSFEGTPILVDNILYLTTHTQKVIALDPETGKEIWRYDATGPGRENRGVAYWPGDAKEPARILMGTGDGRLIALSARTGKPVAGFGDNGVVDLKAGITDRFPRVAYAITSPPTIYRDLVIVGPATQEGPSHGPSGDPRAYDVRTGRLRWRFHALPRPGEPGNDTWEPDGWKDRSGPSQWGFATVDTERGLVFLPIGNPADSFYGADRKGNNLYANSVVALDAQTGKLRWYYQLVHHDIFDCDIAAPPALVEVKRNGRTIPAVAEITKSGLLFILDRMTGKPVFGVEERPVPKSDVPGEQSSPTQPFPVKPPPLSRMTLTPDEITNRTPEARKFCLDWFKSLRFEGPYTPYSSKPSLLLPGTMGGGNWGGVSFDPKLGLIFANTSTLGGVGQMLPAPAGAPMPYRIEGGYTRFLDQEEFPCTQPPWGELSAINANTGDIAWRVPLGSYDKMEAQGLKNAGAPNMGGSIATAGGLVFIAATTDSKFRAFDSRTGKEIWVTRLDATGDAVPMTYLGRNGKQYVVIAAAGTNRFRMIAQTADEAADSLIAFALPSPGQKNPSTSTATMTMAAPPATGALRVRPNDAADNAAGVLPDDNGKEVVARMCTECHGAAVFTRMRLSAQAWQSEVNTMVERGANGTDDEVKLVVAYLTKNFGK
jgi:glucose dehydrogenase